MVTDVDCVVKEILHSPLSSNNEGKNKKKMTLAFALLFVFSTRCHGFYFILKLFLFSKV